MIHIEENLLKSLSSQARHSSRKRKNYNFHKIPGDTLQRMLNALEPETYLQPHKHESPDKREAFIILQGSMIVVEYDDKGNITDHIITDHSTGCYGAEVGPGIYHHVICLEEGTVYYEVKDGPYDPDNDKIFASWAPAENEPEAKYFNKSILQKLGLAAFE